MIQPTDPNIIIDTVCWPKREYKKPWVVQGVVSDSKGNLKPEKWEFQEEENAIRFHKQYYDRQRN